MCIYIYVISSYSMMSSNISHRQLGKSNKVTLYQVIYRHSNIQSGTMPEWIFPVCFTSRTPQSYPATNLGDKDRNLSDIFVWIPIIYYPPIRQ